MTSIAIPLFPHFTALDGIGPYEVLQRIPDFDVTFIGHERGVVRSDNGMLGIEVDATFEELPTPDVVVFPGGFGTRALMTDGRVLDWVRTAHASTAYTTSVCTGSLVLAAAGLLQGLTATTHWGALDVLREHGALPTGERVVEHLDRLPRPRPALELREQRLGEDPDHRPGDHAEAEPAGSARRGWRGNGSGAPPLLWASRCGFGGPCQLSRWNHGPYDA